MLLGARETVVRSAYAVLDPGSVDHVRRAGVLYLTTERLVFEAPGSRGLVRDLVSGRDTEILVDQPLGHLRNASVRKGRWGRPRLVLDQGRHRAAFELLEPESWTVAIADARRAHEIATERSHGHGAVASPPGSGTRCRYCGALALGGSSRCASCGAPL